MAHDAASERLANLNRQCDEKRQQLEQLIVRAPRAGNVVGRNLDALEGRYLAQGSPIVAIGDESAKEVRVSIALEDILSFRSHLGADVSVYFPDSHALVAPLSRIEPGASTTPPHLSLCASHGGDLAIRNAIADTPQGSEPACELLSPRFTGVVTLSAEQSQGVPAGQRATSHLPPAIPSASTSPNS